MDNFLAYDLCDIPEVCVPGLAFFDFECPQEVVQGQHFVVPDILLGELEVPTGWSTPTVRAQWVNHNVTCGLLWYAWGWGTSPGAFEASSGGVLAGPQATGSNHDWFTTIPGRDIQLDRAMINPQDGQQFYVSVEVTNRDGRRSIGDATLCCTHPSVVLVAAGSPAHAACCRAAAGETARRLLTSAMVVYDSSPPHCAAPPCVLVGGLGLWGGRRRTYHPACCPPLVVVPFAEPHSGVARYNVAIAAQGGAGAAWAATVLPVAHGRVCHMHGNCPLAQPAFAVDGPLPAGTVLTANVTATNGAALVSAAETAEFTVDTTAPVAVPAQVLCAVRCSTARCVPHTHTQGDPVFQGPWARIFGSHLRPAMPQRF